MGVLDESLCYLIGAIDAASDHGIGWRQSLIEQCKQAGLNIKFLDPTHKVTGLKEEVGMEHSKIVRLKQLGEFEKLSRQMFLIVRQDHRCVDLSDFIVFYLDPKVHTCGSYFELQTALTQKKPYFIIVPSGKNTAPSWLFGICDHNFIFGSQQAVVDYLVLLNDGIISLSDRWVLFRKQIKEL